MAYVNEKEVNKIFAKNLKYYINVNNITQVELAKKMNVTPATVSNWCNGIKSPRMDKIDNLCKLFNINRSDLIEDKPKTINRILSNQEKALIDKFRQLNEQQKYKVMGYIDNELSNTRKESTPIYKIENTHLKAAEDEIPYNKDSKDTVKVPLVANTGENGYVDIDRGFLEELGRRHMEEREQEIEYNRKTRELLKRFHLEDDED